MSDEEVEAEEAVSEPTEAEPQGQEEQRMVPLAALEAERKKRQDSEAKAQLYQEYMMRAQEKAKEPEEDEDPDALVEHKVLKEATAATKREILETLYQDMNPKALQEINKYLKPILEKKPWLAASVDTALNRYARAYEIVEDYKHLVEEKPATRKPNALDGQRIIDNSQKPRSPAEIGKSAQPNGLEFLKSVQGKREFREYRAKMLKGEI